MPKTTYTIDGNNVCWWYSSSHPDDNRPDINPLIAILCAILENGDDFYCVFDATISHFLMDKCSKEQAELCELLLKDFPTHFFKVTGATRADSVIIVDADSCNRKIISNDNFGVKDPTIANKFPWLKDKYTDRLIQGNLQRNGQLVCEKIDYLNLKVQYNLESNKGNLYKVLKISIGNKCNELDHELQQKQSQLCELNNQIKFKNYDIVKLEKEILLLDNKINENSELSENNTELKKIHDDFTNEINHLKNELLKVNNAKDFDALLQRQNSELIEKNAELKKIHDDFTNEINHLKDELLKVNSARDFDALLQRQNDEFTEIKIDHDKEVERLLTIKNEISGELTSIGKEYDELKSKTGLLLNIDKLEDVIKQKTEIVGKYSCQINNVKKEIKLLENKKKDLDKLLATRKINDNDLQQEEKCLKLANDSLMAFEKHNYTITSSEYFRISCGNTRWLPAFKHFRETWNNIILCEYCGFIYYHNEIFLSRYWDGGKCTNCGTNKLVYNPDYVYDIIFFYAPSHIKEDLANYLNESPIRHVPLGEVKPIGYFKGHSLVNGVCKNCGCSEGFIQQFGNACK